MGSQRVEYDLATNTFFVTKQTRVESNGQTSLSNNEPREIFYFFIFIKIKVRFVSFLLLNASFPFFFSPNTDLMLFQYI